MKKKSWFFGEKINEIYKTLARLTKIKKKEDKNDIGDNTTELTTIKNIISKYYKLIFRNLIT